MVKALRFPIFLAALSAAALLCSSAEADTATIGSPLAASFTSSKMCPTICTEVNTELGESGTNLAAPFAGTVVRWRVKEAEGQFRLRILRPDGAGNYVAVGTSATESPLGLGTETFSADLPIQAGDLVGLDNGAASAKVGEAFGTVGDSEKTDFLPQLHEGNNDSLEEEIEYLETESAFNADVESPPTVGPPAPAPTPAPPAPPAPLPAPIVVPATCKVPSLAGRKLKAAKKTLAKADCKLGKVTKRDGAVAGSGKVKGQSPKAGKVLAAGSKVKVTLKP